jgi:hypothetical protein
MTGMLIDADSGDLLIENGHIAIGDTEAQTAEAVVTAMRGEWKENPLIGGEAEKALGGKPDVMWRGNTLEMLRACGVDAKRIEIADGTITIE